MSEIEENEDDIKEFKRFVQYHFKEYVVCYLDVLGFKEIINSIDANNAKTTDFLESYIEITKAWKTFLEGYIPNVPEEESKEVEIEIISDSIIISARTNPKDPKFVAQTLKKVATAASRLQIEMIKHNFWLRGAITVGNLYKQDHLIIGKALIDAYQLESTYAKYPRIILDNNVIRKYFKSFGEFRAHIHNADGVKGENIIFINNEVLHSRFFKSYLDDLLFVDMISVIFNEVTNPRETLLGIMKRSIKNSFLHADIAEKYLWMQRYILATFEKNFSDDVESIESKEELFKILKDAYTNKTL